MLSLLLSATLFLPFAEKPLCPCLSTCRCDADSCFCDANEKCTKSCYCDTLFAQAVVPVPAPVKTIPGAPFEWRYTDDRTQAGLFQDGVQVGAWRFADKAFRKLNGNVWGEFCPCPTVPPSEPTVTYTQTFQGGGGSACSGPGCGTSAPRVGILGRRQKK